MKLEKKLKALLVLLTLISFATSAMASPGGIYQLVKKGDKVKFDGACFDSQATGVIFATVNNAKKQCDLVLDYELKKQKADHDLQIGKLNIRYETLKEQTDQTHLALSQEIDQLQEAALKRPNQYWYLWAIGGMVVGTLSTLGVVWAVK